MIRYGIQYISKTDGLVKWFSIGRGASVDVQQAHLYTSYELAEKKMEEYDKTMKPWCENFKIIPFDCTPRNPGTCATRMNISKLNLTKIEKELGLPRKLI